MSETKRIRKEEILKALPAGFKTIDELAKILAEGDAAKRKEDLKAWYMTGEGLYSFPPDKQEIMFAKSKNYQNYLNEIAEIDKALPKNTEALRDSLLLYFDNLTKRERASIEKKMKEIGDKALEDERIARENQAYFKQVQAREAEVIEKGKRYDAELTRVNAYDLELKKRSAELDILQGDLERKMGELNETRKELKVLQIAIAKQEQEYARVAKEISGALAYARMLKQVVGPKIEGFHNMLVEMSTYFQNALKKLPNTQVPTAEDIVLPESASINSETILDMGAPKTPKSSQSEK
ncbi:MAG: hypothetical protein QW165_02705 [Candidatus Woesearchaeota archaeon]